MLKITQLIREGSGIQISFKLTLFRVAHRHLRAEIQQELPVGIRREAKMFPEERENIHFPHNLCIDKEGSQVTRT